MKSRRITTSPSRHLFTFVISTILLISCLGSISHNRNLVEANFQQVVSWGLNDQFQLGGELPSADEIFVSIENFIESIAESIVQVAAGKAHSIFLTESGSVYAVGSNAKGQLALGDSAVDDIVAFPKKITGAIADKKIVKVAAGAYHTIFLASDGSVFTAGWNAAGQIGTGSLEEEFYDTPTAVLNETILAGKRVVSIAGGHAHTLLLTADNLVVAFGDNTYAQLCSKDLKEEQSALPVLIEMGEQLLEGESIVEVVAGGFHNLFRSSKGRALSCGRNNFGQTGTNSFLKKLEVPTFVEGVFNSSLSQLAAGAFHSLFLTVDGIPYAAGLNALDGSRNLISRIPVLVYTAGALAEKKITSIAAGGYHSIFITAQGILALGGAGENGQLGTGEFLDTYIPEIPDSLLESLYCQTAVGGEAFTIALCANSAEDVACPEGQYRTESGFCTTCPAGYRCSNSERFICPAGQYSIEGSFECTSCPAGEYSATDGSTSCSSCAAGTYSNPGSSVCSVCPKGTFSESAESSSCQDCPAGSYAPDQGSTSCVSCPAGTYASQNGASGAENCVPCPMGSYSSTVGANSIDTCRNCTIGQFSDVEGATSEDTCMICPEGSIAPASGFGSCIRCDTLCANAARTECTECSGSANGAATTYGGKMNAIIGISLAWLLQYAAMY